MARVFLSISASVSCRNPPTSSHPRAPGSPPSAPQRAAGLMIPRTGPFCPVGRGRGRRQAPCARSWRDVAVATGGSVPHRLLARAGSAAGACPLRFLGQLFSPALRPRFSSWSPPQRGLSDPLVQTVFHFISKPFWSPLGSRRLAQAAAPWVGPSLLSWSLISQNLPRISQYLFCLLEIILI